MDVIPSRNGTVEADKASGSYGDTVTVTVTPAEGYVVKSVTVNDTAITAGADGKYTFTIEEDSVIQATFEKEAVDPDPGDQDSTDSAGSDSQTPGTGDTSSDTPSEVGCGSIVTGASVCVLAALVAVGAAVIRRKKQD